MAIQHLNAEQLNFFPISIPYKPGGRSLSEQNLVNLFKSFTDNESFVSTQEFDNNKIFEFVIHGYYCSIDAKISDTLSELKNELTPNIYAFISLEKSLEVEDPYYIVNCHNTITNEIFEGIHFISAISYDTALEQLIKDPSLKFSPEEINNRLFGLHILTYDNGNFKIPKESLIKLKNHSLLIDEIDGGEI